MPNYPPERESAHNSDDDGHEDDEENDEEEAEEEVVDWTELTPLDDLDALEDGPSTFLVGSFSTCQYLGEAIDRVKYKEDIVVVFPGVYAAARSSSSASAAALELNEARLGGLRIYGVLYAREHVIAGANDNAAVPKYAAVSKRRVGPWFTWLTAAATMALLKEEGGGDTSSSSTNNSSNSRKGNPLKVAASRAVAATDTPAPAAGSGGAAQATATTTSGCTVFAAAITATTANAVHFPILDFPITFSYTHSDGVVPGGLPHYKQEAGDDAAGDDGAEEEDEDAHEQPNDEDDEDGATGSHGDAAGKSAAAARGERAITFAGCCARAGVLLNPLTRTTVTHCVIGSSSAAADGSSPPRIAITAAALTEALVDHCLVFGGTSYGVYAYPRAALTLQSTLVEGANAEAERACGAAAAAAATSASGGAGANNGATSVGGSVMAQLEHRRARAQRLRTFLDGNGGGDDAEATEDGGSGAGSAYVDAEAGVLPRFVVPQTPPTCEVGVMIDDADVRVEDCMVTHTRLGVLLHDACTGTKVRGLDIRSCSEAGLYVYGLAGAAEVVNSMVRACGRACLLIVGPSPAEIAQAAAVRGEDGADDDAEDDAEDADGGAARRPVLAQHPYLKANTFIGAVRVQGEVRSGAVVNNFVFLPKEEKSAAAVATAAQTLVTVEAAARRGFTYVGVEGERVVGRAADQAASAR